MNESCERELITVAACRLKIRRKKCMTRISGN